MKTFPMQRSGRAVSNPETAPTGREDSRGVTGPDGAAGSDARAPRLKLLRFPAVRDRTGLSRSTIWRLQRRGEFPKHYRIAPNAVAWVEEEVVRWIATRIDAVTL